MSVPKSRDAARQQEGVSEAAGISAKRAIASERMGVSEAARTVRGGVPVGVLPRVAEIRSRRRDSHPLGRG